MAVQLPDGALATAVGILIYSFVCLACSVIMILVAWQNHEKDSYVSLLSFATLISTTASIIQQLHTVIRWTDIKTEQFNYLRDHLGNPEVIITKGSRGLDLVLFYIQYYCYNVEAILTACWALALAYSVYFPSKRTQYQRISRASIVIAKVVAILLPALLLSLLRIPAVLKSTPAFLAFADFSLVASLLVGSTLLLAILGKYLYTRRRVQRWIRYYRSRVSSGRSGSDDFDMLEGQRGGGIYDSWLILRFAIAFIFIAIFQLFIFLSEINESKGNSKETLPSEPGLSAAHARGSMIQFLPGVSAGLLVFLVFGTTRTGLRTIYGMLVPRFLRRRLEASTELKSHTTPSFNESAVLTNPRNISQPSGSAHYQKNSAFESTATATAGTASRTASTGHHHHHKEPHIIVTTTIESHEMTERETREHDSEISSINSYGPCKVARNNV